jgi:folate-dependent phosphoribosylglycinamide formyltransferase PurN
MLRLMLQALIDATLDASQGTGAEIVVVVSNRPKVLGLARAQKANIATKVTAITKFHLMYTFQIYLRSQLRIYWCYFYSLCSQISSLQFFLLN